MAFFFFLGFSSLDSDFLPADLADLSGSDMLLLLERVMRPPVTGFSSSSLALALLFGAGLGPRGAFPSLSRACSFLTWSMTKSASLPSRSSSRYICSSGLMPLNLGLSL